MKMNRHTMQDASLCAGDWYYACVVDKRIEELAGEVRRLEWAMRKAMHCLDSLDIRLAYGILKSELGDV